MTTTRVYTSADSGAPSMSRGAAGSAIAVIKACLVDGYGSKAPAGWTMPYSTSGKAAFRNSVAAGGAGSYTRIEDTLTTGTSRFTLQTFASMSDVDTGVTGSHVVSAYRSPAQTANANLWFLAADERTFWFANCDGATITTAHSFCGGGDAFDGPDPYRYFAWGTNGTNANTEVEALAQSAATGLAAANPSGFSFGSDFTGTSGATWHGLLRPYANASTGAATIGSTSFPARPAPNGVGEAALPCYITSAAIIRGKLRGLYIPLANLQALTLGTVKSGDGFGGVGSVVAAVFSGSGTTRGAMWVETALPWS